MTADSARRLLPAAAPALADGTTRDVSDVFVPLVDPDRSTNGPVITHDVAVFREAVVPFLTPSANLHLVSFDSVRETEKQLLQAFRLLSVTQEASYLVYFVGAGSTARITQFGQMDDLSRPVIIMVYCREYFAYMAQTSPERCTDQDAATLYHIHFPAPEASAAPDMLQPFPQPVAA